MKQLGRFTALLLALVATLLLGVATGGLVRSADAAAFPAGNVTLEIWWHEYGPFTAYVKELIEAYKKVHPNVTINPTIASSTDMNPDLLT